MAEATVHANTPAPQHTVLTLDVAVAKLRQDAATAGALVAAAEAILRPGDPGHDEILSLLREVADGLAQHVAELAKTVSALEADLAAAQHGLLR